MENERIKKGKYTKEADALMMLYLVVLSNLEVLNASMIDNNIFQKEKLEKLMQLQEKNSKY